MTDVQRLRLFLSVADQGSFAEAARQSGITPSAVTRAVAALEADLGTQLFKRTTRHVSLTSDGAAFAARIGGLVDDLEAAMDSLRHREAGAHGSLRLSVPVSFGIRVLPDILARFRLSYPGIALSVDMSDALVDIVSSDHDLAVRISGPPSDSSTIWRKICGVDRVLVASPEAPEAAFSTPDALSPARCLGYGGPGGEMWRLTRGRDRRSLRTGRHVTSNNGDLLAQMAAAGAGVALVPRFIAGPEIAAGRLMEVLTDWRPEPLWLTLYYPPYTELPPPVAVFSEFFENCVQTGDLADRISG